MALTTDLSLIIPSWAAPASVTAYTSTRQGGVSQGRYASLNMGLHVQDDAEAVAQNRARLPGAAQLQWLDQIHSRKVHDITDASRQDTLTGDASISRSPHHWCAVMTADCVPVLLCQRDGREVAAIHAGWQGLEKGIISQTISQMRSPPDELLAWIGPAISARHYQVDDALAARFAQVPGACQDDPEPGKQRLDLPAIAAFQLSAAGVDSVTHSHLCTYQQNNQFYSHRRAQHRQAVPTGRMVTVIGINNG